MVKEPKGAFQPEGKEPVIDRLTQLVRRYASRSAAARAWGISVNTLNSYYKTSVEPPMPRENLLANIAAHEGVSLEWLKTGNTNGSPKSPAIIKGGDTQDELSRMLSFLTQDEREQLTMTLARKGVETVLYLLDEKNIKLLQCNDTEKEKFLVGLESGIKKETLNAGQDVEAPDLSSTGKKAG